MISSDAVSETGRTGGIRERPARLGLRAEPERPFAPTDREGLYATGLQHLVQHHSAILTVLQKVVDLKEAG